MEIAAAFTSTAPLIWRARHRQQLVLDIACATVVVMLLVLGNGSWGLALLGVWVLSESVLVLRLVSYSPRVVSILIDDEAYSTSSPGRSSRLEWTTFRSARRLGSYWILKQSSWASLILPVDALDDDQTRGFVALLEHKGLLRES